MVKGLEQFKRHFASHVDQYVLIGGSACTVIMEEGRTGVSCNKGFGY